MARSDKEYYGHAVVDGVPQFYSVSALERGDIRSGGCVLKWHKRYVQNVKDVQSDSKDAGVGLHAELEHYLKHPGAPIMLSATAMRGLPYVPEPGADLLIERTLSSPRDPHLLCDGVPLIVKADLVHDRGTNKGAESPEEMIDPPGTIEVIDWKWKKDGSKAEYYLQPGELIHSIQMSGYGVTIGNLWPDRDTVRLSHVYFPQTRGNPRKVTRLHVIDDARRNWEYVESVGRTLRDVARETDERKVPGNRNACDRYGGCQHRATCYAYARNVEQYTNAKIFGSESNDMGLNLPPTLMNQAPTAAPAGIPAGGFLASLQPQPPAVDMKAQLAAEEAALRAQAAQTAAAVDPRFAQAMQIIKQRGNCAGGPGMPALAGQAATWAAAIDGIQLSAGAGLAGAGQLGGITMSDPNHVIQLASELAALPAPMAPQPVQHNTVGSFLPPGAPESNPALASKPVEGFSVPGQQQVIAATVTLQPQTVEHVAATVGEAVAAAPRRRGRKSNAEKAAELAAQQAAATTAPTSTQPQPTQTANERYTTASDAFDADSAVFINCIPNGEFESLKPYVDSICDAIVAKYKIGADTGLRDVRLASNDSGLGYGKGCAAVRALVIDCPPPAGLYYLDCRNSELAQAVADGIETVCNRVGALCVKGI